MLLSHLLKLRKAEAKASQNPGQIEIKGLEEGNDKGQK